MGLRPGGEDGGVMDAVGMVRRECQGADRLLFGTPAPVEPAPDGGDDQQQRGEAEGGALHMPQPAAGRTGVISTGIGGIEGTAAFRAARRVEPAEVVAAPPAVPRRLLIDPKFRLWLVHISRPSSHGPTAITIGSEARRCRNHKALPYGRTTVQPLAWPHKLANTKAVAGSRGVGAWAPAADWVGSLWCWV